MFALLLSVHKHRMDCTTKKNTSLIAYVIFPSAAPFPAPSLAPFHTELAGNFARKKSFCRCWYFGEPQHILGVNIFPWSLFRTSFEWTWVRLQVLLGRLNGSTNLSGIFTEFHLDRKQVFSELFQFFSPHYYLILNQNSGSENIKGFAKELRKKRKGIHTGSLDWSTCVLNTSAASLTHWTSFQRFEHQIFWFPFIIPSSFNCDWCCQQWLTCQCSFSQLAFFNEEIDPANLYWWNIS